MGVSEGAKILNSDGTYDRGIQTGSVRVLDDGVIESALVGLV